MYEEYQRQEEENIKKGKKGSVSTISGLSAQPTTVNGNLEIREIDDTSQTQTPESEVDYGENADSRNLLAEAKGPEGEAERSAAGVRVEVHDLLVDIKAEKVEATEVKLDDLDLSPEVLGGGGGMENGPLVEVDSLLDSAYCAAVHKLNGSLVPKEEESVVVGLTEDDGNLGPLITLADEKDSVPSNNGFLFPKVDEKLLPSLASTEPLMLPSPEQPPCSTTPHTSSASDDLSLLAHMTSCGSDLVQTPSGLAEDDGFKLQSSLADISTLAEAEAQAAARTAECLEQEVGEARAGKSGGDAASTTSDTERSDDGKDKEMKKIQTTATTQVRITNSVFDLSFWSLSTNGNS